MNRLVARRLIVGSAIIGSVGAFAMHSILPSLPAIRTQFQSTVSATQLLVTLSMLAIATGNLTIGPLSDRFGRRPVIVMGLSLFLAGSLLGAASQSIAMLVIARIVQAFGSGAAMAVARATLVDYFGPERAASGMAYSATAVLLIPMLAPTIGGFVVEWGGWRPVFGLCAVLGTAVLGYTLLRIQETHAASALTRRVPNPLESYRQLLATKAFRGYTFFSAALFASVYTFITGAPHVAIDVMHLSPSSYGLLFMLPAGASFTGFFTAARLSRRMGALRMMKAGAILSLTGGVLLVSLAMAGIWKPLALFPPAMLICFANAISAPNSISSAIGVRPDIAGAASGLTGFLQLLISALIVQLVAALAGATPYPLVFTILACNLAAVALLMAIPKKQTFVAS